MQLGEPEALCVEYHHDRGVGHVDAHFYHRGGHQYLCLLVQEALHFGFLVAGFHLAVYLAQAEFCEHLLQGLVAVFQVFQVALLAFLDQGKHDVDLSAGSYLAPYALIEGAELLVVVVLGRHGFAARGQFVDHAHVEVAVDGHGESARYGGGCHHENMGRPLAFGPQARPLFYTEAVLLVDDGQSEPFKLHVVFYEGMGAHQYLHLARHQSVEYFLAPFPLHDAGEQAYVHVHSLEQLADGGQMLLGKNLGGSHDAGLETVVQRQQHGHEGHQGLPGAHVALQQTVHLLSAAHVFAYLARHSLLCVGEREGQVVVVEGVEEMAYL